MEKITKKNKLQNFFKMENLLCFLIVICPILDISSFIFRNTFNTNFSISTFVRPIIPIIGMAYIFFKDKLKPQILFISVIYGVYAICHLYIFHILKTGCSYGGELKELQYIINYTFMIMNLFIYLYIFVYRGRENGESKEKLISKLKISVLIALTLYITFMYIALITGTSSHTYTEDQIGYKGWFESGNSIGTIMILSVFIVFTMTGKKNNKYVRIWGLVVIAFVGVYLATLLGTRTGLLGFCVVAGIYIMLNLGYKIFHNKKVDKRIVAVIISVLIIGSICVAFVGSKTFERRKQLKERENEIYDEMQGQTAHVTGDIVNIVKQIKDGTLDTEYMSSNVQKAMMELYDIANEKNVSNTDSRMLQLIYHSQLIKRQNQIPILLFGNGYMTHFYEMIFEMEVPAFLYNFGVIGFFLYFMPFLTIAVYGVYALVRERKSANVEFAMMVAGLWFAICISFLSGYTFFNSSTMMIIISLCVFLINDIKNIEDSKIKIYNKKVERQ